MKKVLPFILIITSLVLSNKSNSQNPLLWGITGYGGANNGGTIFKIYGDGTGFQTEHDFNVMTGDSAYGSLTFLNNKFYGATQSGGAHFKGTVFSLDANNTYTDLHNFTGNAGNVPRGKLLHANNGNLYGMTFYDDSIGAGVIYKFNPINNAFSKLATFNGTGNGQSPRGSLMQASNGKIYGLAQGGGANQLGTLFSFDTVTNVITNLHSFSTATGFNPFGEMIEASNGLLYGLNMYFGTTGPGTIFSFNPATNVYTNLINFSTTNGAFPEGHFIQASDGKLYGLSFGGGANVKGVLFSYTIATNTITDLVVFNGTNGSLPTGSLFEGSDHILYGMTTAGGANNLGIVFSYNPATSAFTNLHDFNGTDGSSPFGSLIEANPTVTTGIEMISNNKTTSLSPNPSSGNLSLSYSVSKANSIFHIIDVAGRIIYTHNLTAAEGKESMDVTELAGGIYFWEIISGSEIESKGKLALQK